MTFSILPGAEKKNCTKCLYYIESYAGYEEGGYLEELGCDKIPRLGNLKSFPFSKIMPCFQLDFWHSKFVDMIDGTDESMTLALDAWQKS